MLSQVTVDDAEIKKYFEEHQSEFSTPELRKAAHILQIVHDRQHDRLASAAAHRLVAPNPARTRIARTLRRAADRLDTATSPSAVSALPGGGFEPPPGLSAR